MGRLRVLSGREVCRILQQHRFVEVRRHGSHVVMQRRTDTGSVTVPFQITTNSPSVRFCRSSGRAEYRGHSSKSDRACFARSCSRCAGWVVLGVGRSGTRPTAFCRIPQDRIAQVLKKSRVGLIESLTLHHMHYQVVISQFRAPGTYWHVLARARRPIGRAPQALLGRRRPDPPLRRDHVVLLRAPSSAEVHVLPRGGLPLFPASRGDMK
jgi:predicted RNA binding protein YcfA (HicA-like mRNA interferase family)